MMEDLTNEFEKEIFKTSIDLSKDYIEIGLNQLMEESVLSEIPIIKTLASFYNISSAIKDRHNLKKIIVFLSEFHSNNINDEKIENFKKKFAENPDHKNLVLETILMLNERFIDTYKSKILANLFLAYINDKLTWDEFFNISFILSNLNPSTYDFLKKTLGKNSNFSGGLNKFQEGQAQLIASGLGNRFDNQFVLTKTALKLYDFGIEPLNY